MDSAVTGVGGAKVPQEVFDALVKFYEADKELTQEDRKKLRDVYSRAIVGSNVVSWLGFATTSSIPMVRYYQAKGSLRGFQMTKAFWYGLPGLFIGLFIGGNMVMPYIRKQTADNPRLANVTNQVDMSRIHLMYQYYRSTARDPQNIMRDPRLTENYQKRPSVLTNRDPMGLRKGRDDVAAEGTLGTEGIPGETSETSEISGDSVAGLGGSAWERVRKEHGIEPPQYVQRNAAMGSTWQSIRQQELNRRPSPGSDQTDSQASGSDWFEQQIAKDQSTIGHELKDDSEVQG